MNSKKKKLLNETYHKFIQTSFHDLPLEGIEEFIDEKIMGYGTALDEKILSIFDYRNLVNRQREQGKDIKMQFDNTPVVRKIAADGNSAVFVDEIKIQMIIDNSNHQIFIRLSSVLEFRDQKWIVVHWHGSKPEYEEGESDSWHVNEWKQKNAELEKLVDEKTVDLIEKNRELEIEASLERVRAVAMGMNKSDDLLKICEVSFKEFKNLDFNNLRNAVIHIPNDEQKYFMDYDFSDFTGGQIGKVEYGLHPIVDEYLIKIRSAEDAFFEVVIDEAMLESWNEFRRKSGQMYDQRLDKAKAIYYYLFSIGIGDIGISTFLPISDSQIKILKRFRNVFDLAYRRYKDISQAEAQAREAEIQLALERVRARAMAMRKSEELADLSFELVKQVHSLGIDTWFCAFNIYDDEIKGSLEWGSNLQGTYEKYRTPREGIFLRYYEAGQRGDKLLVNEINEEECPAHYEYLCTLPGVGEQLLKMKDAGISFPTSQIDHVAFFKYGYIIFITFKPVPESHAIFKRFANVFEQSYTRFMDLQRAEAQAREAEVEASLERIRSLALGMRKSEEVGNVTDQLFQELIKLNISANGGSIVVFDETFDVMELWRARTNIAIKPFESTSFSEAMKILKKHMPEWYPTFIKALEKRKNYLVDVFTAEMRLQFINAIMESYKYLEEEKLKILENTPEKITTHFIFFKLGYLALIGEKKLSDDNLSIARRFVEVFDFSYTRYLDIKNAEEQARESQIEAALERVRSRSMAMHSSDELVEASDVMFNQMRELGIECLRIGIGTMNEKDKTVEIWSRSEIKGKVENRIVGVVPFGVHPVFDNMVKAWREKKPYFASERIGDEVKEYYKRLSKYLTYPLPKKFNKRESVTTFFFKAGSLNVISLEPLKKEECDIMIRFAKVFEQTYTRFLDLQKAEAQAREAQIEASLERVRSVAMSMMKSDELLKVCESVFSELRLLGFSETDLRNTQIVINNDEKEIYNGYQYSDYSGGEIAEVSYDMHPIIRMLNDKLKQSTDAFADIEISGEAMDDWKAFVNSFPQKPDEKLNFASELHYYFYSVGIGALGISSFKSLPEDKLQILQRLRNVFNLSYQRYVDISQSEAQAREAQIELALERVRARTMGMQKSEELKEVIRVIYDQFVQLKINIEHTGFIVEYKTRDDMHIWLADKNGPLSEIIFPYFDSPHWNSFIDAKEKGLDFFANHLNFEEKNKFYKKLFTFIPNLPEEAKNFYINCPGLAISTVLLENVGLYIENFSGIIYSDEENKILMRFGKVFQQTYTRFLDLQKAEAQAREAQIEAALERVRARTMAMQKSNELAKTAAHLFEQLSSLGIKPYRCNIAIVNTESGNFQLWSTTNSGNVIPTSSSLPLDEYPVLQEVYDGWKAKRVGHTIKIEGKERVAWANYISKYVPFDEYKPKNINENNLLHEIAIFSMCYFKQGYFIIHTKEEITAEDYNIIQKFAKVFEQTYTRFLDLENSEIQNKIIQEENERKTEELEEARQLQLAMLPKELPQIPHLDIAVYMQTATEVGGDYYDFHLDKKGVLTTVIGDATGHGMKAGTIVTITKSLFNSLASEKNILKVFSQISQVIRDMKFRQLSMCLMMLKIIGNKVQISSAAMPPAFLFRKKENKAHEIVLNGMPLGALPKFPYKIEETVLNIGDTILLMSDGYPELMNDKGHMFGYEKALRLFEELGHKPAEEIIEGLKKSASDWVNDKMPDDDVTFVVIKVK